MRLKRNRLMTIHHRKAKTEKDSEGHVNVVYGSAVQLQAEMWPAGGKLQAEMYGIRLPNIRNLRVDGKYQEVCRDGETCFLLEDGTVISAKDGICLYSRADEDPDYEVVAIRPYTYLTLEVERRV